VLKVFSIHSNYTFIKLDLKRPSDGGTSESLPFYFLPKTELNNNKRQRINSFPYRKPVVNQQKFSHSNQIQEEVFVPRIIQSDNHYILPRLSYPNESQINETFYDFNDIGIVEENDLNCIEGNNNSFVSFNDQYWTECDVKTDMSEAIVESNINSDENIELLDISQNIKQCLTSVCNSQKHFLCA
jgi:hypothetical protein